MGFIVEVLRTLEVMGFLIANVITYLFFNQFLPGLPLLLFLGAGVISVLLLKTHWVFWLYERLKHEKSPIFLENPATVDKISNTTSKTISKLRNISLIKGGPIGFKTMSFNVLYELFPVFLIWLGVIGAAYLISNVLLEVSYSPSPHFFEIIASFGIILGVFQYYLQRQEGKIAVRISIYGKAISEIIREETTFDKFYESLSDIRFGLEIQRWIDKKIDPKLQLIEVLRTLSENKAAKEVAVHMLKRTRPSTLFNVHLTYLDSDKKYEMLEASASAEQMKLKLISAYDSFFNSTEKIDEIILKINSMIDVREFGNLCLSNINMVPEVFAQLINSQLQSSVEDLLIEGGEDIGIENTFSFRRQRELLEGRVTKRLLDDIFN